MVQISPSAAERQQNRGYMVRLEVKPRLAKQTGLQDCAIKVCSSVIQPAAVVRDLGLHLDSELEAACEQGGRHLLLSSTQPSPDPQTSRQ